MKWIAIFWLVLLASVCYAQETVWLPDTPEQIRKLEWLLGEYTAECEMFVGATPIKVVGSSSIAPMRDLPIVAQLLTIAIGNKDHDAIVILTFSRRYEKFTGELIDWKAGPIPFSTVRVSEDRIVLVGNSRRVSGTEAAIHMRVTYSRQADGKIGLLIEHAIRSTRSTGEVPERLWRTFLKGTLTRK